MSDPRAIRNESITDKRKEWWREAVIYQVYPRSFMDSNGDGVGDLPGITARLAYIAELGVDIVWISPFFTSPMRDFGYDVADYCDVDPLFGTLADFDELVSQAHALGLKIMIDQVLSHTSDAHPWFIQSRSGRSSRDNPKADWYVWADPQLDGTPPNNWLSIFGGSAWQWDSGRCQYYLHNFLTSQPDMNFHQAEVQQAHLQNMRFWLERGVDGFRLDACIFHFHDQQLRNNPAVTEHKNAAVSRLNPYGMQAHIYDTTRPENLPFFEKVRSLLDEFNAVSIGEIGADDALAVMAEYTADDNKLHMAYSFNLLTEEHTAAHIRSQVEQFEARVKGGWASWSVGNHDVARVMTRWGGLHADPAYAKIILAMQLALKGTPCLYQGDELGLAEADLPFEVLQDPVGLSGWPQIKGRDGCRTPMPWDARQQHAGFSTGQPWLPLAPEHLALSVAQQQPDPNSVFNFSCHLLRWRKAIPQLRRGAIAFYDAPEPVLAIRRELDGLPAVLALLNLGAQAITFTLPESASYAALQGHGLAGSAVNGSVTLPPFGGWFGVQKK